MQAMVLLYPVRFSFLDTPLGTFCATFSTANAFFGNVITLFCYCTTTQCIRVPENRIHTVESPVVPFATAGHPLHHAFNSHLLHFLNLS